MRTMCAPDRQAALGALVARGLSVALVMAKITVAQDSIFRKRYFEKTGEPIGANRGRAGRSCSRAQLRAVGDHAAGVPTAGDTA